jgi:lipoprotein-releasing system permease protein
MGRDAAPAEVVGREKTRGLVLDVAQARPLGIVPGETVTLVSSRSRLSPLGPVPIVSTEKVTALAPSSTGRRAAEASLPLDEARRLFALGADGATGYEVFVKDAEHPGPVAAAVQAALGPSVGVTTWEDQNRALVLALRLERFVLFAAVFLIVIVAGLNLAATSAVLAATRARDAAVLSVLGASPKTVEKVFRAAGGGVGLAGTLAGVLLGAALSVFLERTGLVPLPAQLYGMSHAPFRLDPFDVAAVAGLSILWAFVVASVPARTAARQPAVEALRGG